MKRHDPTPPTTPESDPEAAPVDRLMRRAMPVQTPRGLNDRLYEVSVGNLAGRGSVLARIGDRQTLPWAMAAAVGLVFFYAAAWLNPYMDPPRIGNDEIAAVQQSIAPPNARIDQEIDELGERIASLTGEFDDPLHDLTPLDDGELARELIELERELGQRTF